VTHRAGNSIDGLTRDYGASRVMDEDDVRVVGQNSQSQHHRLLAGFTSSDHHQFGFFGNRVEHELDRRQFAFGCRHHDDVNGAGFRQGANSVNEQGLTR
jgi:hypothetical protein